MAERRQRWLEVHRRRLPPTQSPPYDAYSDSHRRQRLHSPHADNYPIQPSRTASQPVRNDLTSNDGVMKPDDSHHHHTSKIRHPSAERNTEVRSQAIPTTLMTTQVADERGLSAALESTPTTATTCAHKLPTTQVSAPLAFPPQTIVTTISVPRQTAVFQDSDEETQPELYACLFNIMQHLSELWEARYDFPEVRTFLQARTCICYSTVRPVQVGDRFVVFLTIPSYSQSFLKQRLTWIMLEECAIAVYTITQTHDPNTIEGVQYSMLWRPNWTRYDTQADLEWAIPQYITIPSNIPSYLLYTSLQPTTIVTKLDIPTLNNLNRQSALGESDISSTQAEIGTLGSFPAGNGQLGKYEIHNVTDPYAPGSSQSERAVVSTPCLTATTYNRDDTASSDLSQPSSSSYGRSSRPTQTYLRDKERNRQLPPSISNPQSMVSQVSIPLPVAPTTHHRRSDVPADNIDPGHRPDISTLRHLITPTHLENLLIHPTGTTLSMNTQVLCDNMERELTLYNCMNNDKIFHARVAFKSLYWYVQRYEQQSVLSAVVNFNFRHTQPLPPNCLRLNHFLPATHPACTHNDSVDASDVLLLAWRGIACTYGSLYDEAYDQTFTRIAQDLQSLIPPQSQLAWGEWSLQFLGRFVQSLRATQHSRNISNSCELLWSHYETHKQHLPVARVSFEHDSIKPLPAAVSLTRREQRIRRSTGVIPASHCTERKAGPCVRNLQKVYNIPDKVGNIPLCSKACNYIHHELLGPLFTRSTILKRVATLRDQFTDSDFLQFTQCILTDPSLPL